MKIKAIHHLRLTVTDLEKSRAFYEKFPGFKTVALYEDFVMFSCGDFYLGLVTHDGKAQGPFDETTVGMDHVAFGLSHREDLDEALAFLDAEGISHNGIQELSNGTCIVVFRDPDNIQLEFAWRRV